MQSMNFLDFYKWKKRFQRSTDFIGELFSPVLSISYFKKVNVIKHLQCILVVYSEIYQAGNLI